MEAVRSLDRDLWVVDHPLRLPGGIEMGTRTTLVRLRNGELWMHSPGPFTPEVREWIASNGPLGAIVAPNLLHHFYLRAATEAFPGVPVFGPAGLEEKVGVSMQVLEGGRTPWEAELASVAVGGCPRMNELEFFHAPTRTLVLTDLAFNFRRVDSFATRLFLRINGAYGRLGPSRLGRSWFLQDKEQVRAALEKILQWDFDRIVLAHGEVCETGGREALRRGYAWLLA